MKTKVDHWLSENLLLQTHIYTMRLPEDMPRKVKVQELPESASRRYRYRLVSGAPKATDQLVNTLRDEGLLFSTQVVERDPWFRPLIAPKGGSIVYNIFWLISGASVIWGGYKLMVRLQGDANFMAQLKEAIALFSS
ncbi:MAG: hypothetical protein AAGC74_03560 [Verrucomicrobiota bacterium]